MIFLNKSDKIDKRVEIQTIISKELANGSKWSKNNHGRLNLTPTPVVHGVLSDEQRQAKQKLIDDLQDKEPHLEFLSTFLMKK